MSTLDLAQIQELLAGNRTRGGYLSDCKEFFASGNLAIDFSEMYPTRESGSLRTSVKSNATKAQQTVDGKLTPAFQIVMVPNGDKKHVVLINMDVYHTQKQLDAQSDEV